MFVLIWYHEKTACANRPQQKDWETVTMEALGRAALVPRICASQFHHLAIPMAGQGTAKHWTLTEAFHIVPLDDLMR